MANWTATVFVLGGVAFTVAVVVYKVRRLSRARPAMEQALHAEGLTVVSAGLCWVPRGPFLSAIAFPQPVYRSTVQGKGGVTRTGWVRCVPFSEETEIAWD